MKLLSKQKEKGFQETANFSKSLEIPYFKPISVLFTCFETVDIPSPHGLRGQNECHLSTSVLGNISTSLLALSVYGNISNLSLECM